MSRKLIRPTDEEDAAITAAALGDPDALPLTDAELVKLRPVRGRPSGRGTKVQMTIRVDAEVIRAFKQGGDGWQTRMNDALKEWLASHRSV
ncbi:MAG: BrnA antitoxin family protein [Oxalobacteraceae bacterium]|jgi:uncharacterized protein (DUF4415 family)|nr:BrnA antitoxin family protein [Oxalobacteraceae bacterium]